MKEFSELRFGEGLRYTNDHEWVATEGEELAVGVTDYAQDQMGDIVYVELPEPGTVLEKGDELGSLESVKAVSELFVPISGEVVAVNEALVDEPELINADAYANWIAKIRPAARDELESLLSKEQYQELVKG